MDKQRKERKMLHIIGTVEKSLEQQCGLGEQNWRQYNHTKINWT
jgi:hypothetical protein